MQVGGAPQKVIAPPAGRNLRAGALALDQPRAGGVKSVASLKSGESMRHALGGFFGSWRGAAGKMTMKAAAELDASDSYCPTTPPASGSGDVFNACTPGLNITCCAPLTCIALNSHFSACCLGKGDPSGCAAPPPPPPPPQSCGVQHVTAGTGYETNALGQTTPAAFNTCNITTDPGYSNSVLCNQPVPPHEVRDPFLQERAISSRLISHPIPSRRVPSERIPSHTIRGRCATTSTRR
jgi:hypothetical protein